MMVPNGHNNMIRNIGTIMDQVIVNRLAVDFEWGVLVILLGPLYSVIYKGYKIIR